MLNEVTTMNSSTNKAGNIYKKFRCWFNKYSTGWIGVAELGGDRILIHDSDTLAEIEVNLELLRGVTS